MPAPFVYLDHAASTPLRPGVLDAMLPFFETCYANPSGSHRFARQARAAVDAAREAVAVAVGCQFGEVVFTGGGTEADNAALFGVAGRTGGRLVCSAVEHHAVLEAVHALGGETVAVDEAGALRLEALEAAVSGGVTVLSLMAVNNEVGTVQPLAEAARAVRSVAPHAVVHTDAIQAPCWLDLRTVWPCVDVLSLSAHKFGGPKGVGALVVRDSVGLQPLLRGGGQERDRRSGTHNVAGIVGMAEALRSTDECREGEVERIGALRRRFVDTVTAGTEDVRETVPPDRKVAGSAHLCARGVENEALLFMLDRAGVCASAASACASGAMEPSHVLHAMGVEREWAGGAVRFSLGRTTTEEDVDTAAQAMVHAVNQLRARAASRR